MTLKSLWKLGKWIFKALVVVFVISLVFNLGWFVKWIYPIKYGETISIYAKEFDVDPFLILSIIKVESGFDPNAKSVKGAMGLMQIMPETGTWIAGMLGIEDFQTNDLYNPKVNIRLGSWYISKLFDTFGGNLAIAIAAYNGGEGNVSQWLKDGRWSGDIEELEDVPFKETSNYIRSVRLVYSVYEKLYSHKWPYP